ncbi:hypothetical protein OHS59_29025 [Streptomyces sp. NBC_00414]|uniref:hypothetical protein n=1 Tax=Streptomyces sp. NBC_00414 TaxID=2975739 RepID=UPI002E21F8D8
MPLTRSLATADEIHDYLVSQLNLALRRPGMFGREGVQQMLMDHLLFVENEPEAWAQQQHVWEDRGIWTGIGVEGAFWDMVPGHRDENTTTSIYAEFAHCRGWLAPDRVLTSDEYRALRDRARSWASGDREWADVTAEFGAPSLLIGGTNPYYGKTLGYLGENPEEPIVFFHLWNGSAPGDEASWPELQQPVLLGVRFGDGPFPSTFTFTPEGLRRRPQRDPDGHCH